MSNNLKALRKQKGMSQEELADRAGISRLAVLHAENGKNLPTLATSKKLSDVLQTPIDDIFFGKLVTREIHLESRKFNEN